MTKNNAKITLRASAIIAGLGILLMVVTVPFSEFKIFPSLIDYNNSEITAKNLLEQKHYFILGIFLNFITIICDIIVAWALYIFLKPANKYLSLLTGWFRLVYAGIYLIALSNLLKVLVYLNEGELINAPNQNHVYDQILFHLKSFGYEMGFAHLYLGLYLGLLGYLLLKASYVPKIFGWLIIIAGFGYFTTSMGNILFPHINTELLTITFLGELIFMVWLLIKGGRNSKEDN